MKYGYYFPQEISPCGRNDRQNKSVFFSIKKVKPLRSETMKITNSIFLAAFLFPVIAFAGEPKPDFIGTYGISKNHPVKFELKINADKTFTYQDYADANNRIDAQGTWELKNNKIILQGQTSTFPYRSKWKIEKDGKAVRSRKGLEFIRLAKL